MDTQSKILLVTGANGQLGQEYMRSQPVDGWEYVFTDRTILDITSPEEVSSIVRELKPSCILNVAAYTNVEKAEKQDTEKAHLANAVGPRNLAIVAAEHDIPLIHISTDYVFDGETDEPYTEESLPNPINNYGRTKLLGDVWIQENHDWYYILRVSWVYSNHAPCFYNTMLRLAQERSSLNVVNDQYGSPTSTKEICRAIDCILRDLDREKTGIYNFSGLGQTTWKEFAEEIFRAGKIAVIVNGVSSDAWPSTVSRPKRSYLNSSKFIETFGHFPAHWKNALVEMIKERRHLPLKVGDIVKIEGKPNHIIVATDWQKRIAWIAPHDNLSESHEMPFDILIST